VILVDANLLIYAYFSASPQHQRAREWLDGELNGFTAVGLPWPSLLAFVRLVTNPRIFRQATSPAEAWRQVLDWLACEPVWIPQATERHAEVLGSLISLPGMNANLVMDAHLAAMAIEHGLSLCSTDGDFARFPELRWTNPLTD
jgi:toxin-antitoxin system PIN domain toxin